MARTNAATMGAPIHQSSATASTIWTPKGRKTPATIAMTTGIGRTAMNRSMGTSSPTRSTTAAVIR